MKTISNNHEAKIIPFNKKRNSLSNNSSHAEIKVKLENFYNQFTGEEISIQQAVRKQSQAQNQSEQTFSHKEKRDDFYPASFSGLALLSSFFPVLFKNLDFLDDEDKIREEKISPAMNTLYYLASGNTSIPEDFDSRYCLLLLGVKETHQTTLSHKISVTEIEEADHMLGSFMSHCPAIATLLLQGVREGFFQRGGTIMDMGSNYQLEMDSHPLDVLLRTVPWGIGVSFHPWMDKPLIIEWGT